MFPFDQLDRLSPQLFEEQLLKHRDESIMKGVKIAIEGITVDLESAINEEINKFKLENNIKVEN